MEAVVERDVITVAVVESPSIDNVVALCGEIEEEQGFELFVKYESNNMYFIDYAGECLSECIDFFSGITDGELSMHGVNWLIANVVA